MRRFLRHRAAGSALPQPSHATTPALPQNACRLASVGIVVSALLFAGTVETQNAVANGDTRTLSLVHTHTGESGTITFKRDGRYDRAALEQMNWLLRDFRENEATKMDPRLFDVVWEAQRALGSTAPLRVVGGYRSPKTNGMLRARSSGVAEHSQHMLGKAMDFFIPDVSVDEVRAAGMRLQRGGVGWYPRSNFVHLDVGSVRAWPRMTRDQLARIFPDGKTVHLPADGKPLARYDEARAEILARGGTVHGVTTVAQADAIDDGPGIKGFFAGLFGSDSKSSSAPVPAATPGAGRGKSSVLVASADPDDAVGAKQALAFAAPNSNEALRDSMLRREGRNAASAKDLLTADLKRDGAAEASLVRAPLPPRRPSEFAAVTAALNAPLPPARPVLVAGLGHAGLGGSSTMTTEFASLPPARLVPATASPQEQLSALFIANGSDAAKPASRNAPVQVALLQPKPGAVQANHLEQPDVVIVTQFSSRSPGDELAASHFSGSATQALPIAH